MKHENAENYSKKRKINHKEKDTDEAPKAKVTDMAGKEEYVTCTNCNWIGKQTALLKHLRMKTTCRSMSDMQTVYAEQEQEKEKATI